MPTRSFPTRPRRGLARRLLALVLITGLLPISSAVALSGCGDDTKASKAEIALRLGLAYGAFKRYAYVPAQEGKFKKGADGRKRAIAKAAVAGAFAGRMLVKAKEEADQDPEFKALAAKIVAAGASIGGISSVLKGGDELDITSIAAGLGSLDSLLAAGKDLGIVAKEENVSAADLLK